jgi:hypothetical protein
MQLADAGDILELVGSEFQNESSPAEGSAGCRSLAGHRHIPLAALTKFTPLSCVNGRGRSVRRPSDLGRPPGDSLRVVINLKAMKVLGFTADAARHCRRDRVAFFAALHMAASRSGHVRRSIRLPAPGAGCCDTLELAKTKPSMLHGTFATPTIRGMGLKPCTGTKIDGS